MPMFNTSNPFRSSSGSSTQSSQRRGPARKPHQPPRAGPPPPDPRLVSLSQLDSAATRLAELRKSFVLPRRLSFDPKSRPDAPKLDYSPGNAPFHAFDEALTKLLIELDGVDSCGGEVEIRTRRKQLVLAVEQELERLDDLRKREYAKQLQAPNVEGGDEGKEIIPSRHDGRFDHAAAPLTAGAPSLPPGIPLPPRDYPPSAASSATFDTRQTRQAHPGMPSADASRSFCLPQAR
ncbi:hypothetical protein JCM11491_005556 [Sporobolomyces phaffii]